MNSQSLSHNERKLFSNNSITTHTLSTLKTSCFNPIGVQFFEVVLYRRISFVFFLGLVLRTFLLDKNSYLEANSAKQISSNSLGRSIQCLLNLAEVYLQSHAAYLLI